MTGPRRRVYVRVRMTPEESRRLTDKAHAWGFRTTAEFIRASLGRIGQMADEMRHMEKCQAATLGAMRDDIARLQRTEHVLFAMLENLAKTILTTIPPLSTESKVAAIAYGRTASGIPDLTAHSERGRQEEAALSESLQRGRISRAGRQADPKTTLHDCQRTRADRSVCTWVSEKCDLHHRGDGPAAVQGANVLPVI